MDFFDRIFGKGTFSLAMSPAKLLENAKLIQWFRSGPENVLLAEVPYPTDGNGRSLPHGSVLDFSEVPITLHSRRALVWWLRLRHVNVPLDYPMGSFVSECGSTEPGLVSTSHTHTHIHIPLLSHTHTTPLLPPHKYTLTYTRVHPLLQVALVRRAMRHDAPCMTLEDVQRLGALDPVNVSIDADGPCFSLENDEDGPKILEVINQLKIADEDIGLDDDGLFGLRPTDRDRGMQLFRGGNVVSESVKVTSGTLRNDRTPVWIISGDVVASQRGK